MQSATHHSTSQVCLYEERERVCSAVEIVTGKMFKKFFNFLKHPCTYMYIALSLIAFVFIALDNQKTGNRIGIIKVPK